MKSIFAVLLFILTPTSVPALGITLALDPVSPTPVVTVQLTLSRDFPNPCYETTANVNKTGNTIEVQITSTPQDLICPQVIAPQAATVDVGLLQSGTYQVNVTWHGGPRGAQ